MVMASRKIIIHNHRGSTRDAEELTAAELKAFTSSLDKLERLTQSVSDKVGRGDVGKSALAAVRRAVAALANV
jgi:hypothetical protein